MPDYDHDHWQFKPRRHSKNPRHILRAYLNHRTRRIILIVFLLALTYYFLNHLPAPPKTENNTSAGRPPPEHDVETRPHFLYQSPLRKDPDADYEGRLEDALKSIERNVLSTDYEGGEADAESRIWQIMLQRGSQTIDRARDSELFEERNSEWSYTVRYSIDSFRKGEKRRILILLALVNYK